MWSEGMMERRVTLVHSVHRDNLDEVLRTGLKAASDFPDMGLEMRRGVVYCWLRAVDDKFSSNGQRQDHVYVEVNVDEDRCVVADMTYITLAMMYQAGQMSKPKNPEAARLLTELYKATAVPVSEYLPGMFDAPEVLVRGDVSVVDIRLCK